MGKTWRRIPGAFNDDGTPNYARRTKQPKKVTAEWALRRLARRIDIWTESMIANGAIRASQREDVHRRFEDRVRHAVELYDADRKGRSGAGVAATTYLCAAFEYAAQNIVRDMNRQCRSAVEVSIVDARPEEAEAEGDVSSADPVFSDGCRTVERLWLRMDVAALMAALPPSGRTYVKMQYEGYSQEETAAALGISRRTLCRRVVPVVELTARLYGFFPREDRQKGVDDERLYRKGGKLRPAWAA